MDQEKNNSLFVKCDCHCCGLSIERWSEDDDETLSLSFWIDKFYAYQIESFWSRLYNRIKLCFKILKDGDYFLQNIVINKEDMKKLKNYFNQF